MKKNITHIGGKHIATFDRDFLVTLRDSLKPGDPLLETIEERLVIHMPEAKERTYKKETDKNGSPLPTSYAHTGAPVSVFAVNFLGARNPETGADYQHEDPRLKMYKEGTYCRRS